MTNKSKFVTVTERIEAFRKYCEKMHDRPGGSCGKQERCSVCSLKWLDLEAEGSEPLPCPFCGGGCELVGIPPCTGAVSIFRVKCEDCSYQSGDGSVVADEAIAAHNRVAKAVKGSEVNYEAH